MSTCISSEGEYSDHTLDDAYMCTRCFALDEDSMTRELLYLRAKVAAIDTLTDPERGDGQGIQARSHPYDVAKRMERAREILTIITPYVLPEVLDDPSPLVVAQIQKHADYLIHEYIGRAAAVVRAEVSA